MQAVSVFRGQMRTIACTLRLSGEADFTLINIKKVTITKVPRAANEDKILWDYVTEGLEFALKESQNCPLGGQWNGKKC